MRGWLWLLATFFVAGSASADNACKDREFGYCSLKVVDINRDTTIFNPKVLFHGDFHFVAAAAPTPLWSRSRADVYRVTAKAAQNLCHFFNLGDSVGNYDNLTNEVSDNLFGWIRVVELVPVEDHLTARWSQEPFHFYKVVCSHLAKN
jgi:hypothetical protein